MVDDAGACSLERLQCGGWLYSNGHAIWPTSHTVFLSTLRSLLRYMLRNIYATHYVAVTVSVNCAAQLGQMHFSLSA